MQKEQWSTHSFNNICWKRNKTRHVKQKQQKCVTTYGKQVLIMNNGMAKQNRAACVAIMKTGGMS
jgi:hypothetical protein